MENKELYRLIGDMALEFRLSLRNICKLLGKEVTEKTMMEIYNNINSIKDFDIKNKYKYLFFYETFNESQNASMVAYTKALNYIKRYNMVVKEGTKEEKIKILDELHKTDNDLKSIKNKLGNKILNEDEITIVSKFRIKHVISKSRFGEIYNVSFESISSAEKKLQSKLIKEKLERLNEYYLTISSQVHKRKI